MDRRNYGAVRGRPRSIYQQRGSSSENLATPNSVSRNSAAQNPNIDYRSSRYGSTGGHRSGSVSGNIQEDDTEADRLPGTSVGTCNLMCPDRERAQRERLRDLAIFERLHGDPCKSSPELAVKKFCRTMSANDSQASDLRPLPVLEHTLKYLLQLEENSERPFELVHDFVFDRMRSLRQDLSIQNIYNDQAIQMYEEMVKFHITSHYKLQRCSPDPHTSSSQYLNMEQLMKTLTSLFSLYETNRENKPTYENEAEFCSFYILLHLDSRSKSKVESLTLWFRSVPSPIMKSKEVTFARRVFRAFRTGNFKQFFCAISAEASHLHYCIIEPCCNEVRAFALSCINHCGYKLHPYPLERLSKILMMTNSEVELFCHACGLETFVNESGEKFFKTKQASFCHPKDGFQNYSFLGLEHYEK